MMIMIIRMIMIMIMMMNIIRSSNRVSSLATH